VGARSWVAAALLALAATYALVSVTAAQDAMRVQTGDADLIRPVAGSGGRTYVTMHGSVETASFAAVWFEYRTGFGPLRDHAPHVIRTEPVVVAEGSHRLARRSRAVEVLAPFDYRVVASAIDSKARGLWRFQRQLPLGHPAPPDVDPP